LQISRIPIPTPFPVGPVNAYLIGPEPLTLVDCGPCSDEAWEALCRGVQEAGRAIQDVERVVLTHPHHDHAGLARRVQERAGCPVFAHRLDVARLRGRAGEWEAIVAFLVEACRRAGVPGEVLAAFREGFVRFEKYAEPIDEVCPLEEGGVLGIGAGRLEALHTPGHARGALCLWDAEQELLLSGDTLLPHISSNPVLEPGTEVFRQKTLPPYLESLRRIVALAPRAVLPGHGEPMGDPLPLIRKRMTFHEARAERILKWVGPGPTTPWQVVERLFPALPPTQAFLGVSEVVGHLDLLAERGQVAFEGQEGPWVVGLP